MLVNNTGQLQWQHHLDINKRRPLWWLPLWRPMQISSISLLSDGSSRRPASGQWLVVSESFSMQSAALEY
jgi:hypothetical protein